MPHVRINAWPNSICVWMCVLGGWKSGAYTPHLWFITHLPHRILRNTQKKLLISSLLRQRLNYLLHYPHLSILHPPFFLKFTLICILNLYADWLIMTKSKSSINQQWGKTTTNLSLHPHLIPEPCVCARKKVVRGSIKLSLQWCW